MLTSKIKKIFKIAIYILKAPYHNSEDVLLLQSRTQYYDQI